LNREPGGKHTVDATVYGLYTPEIDTSPWGGRLKSSTKVEETMSSWSAPLDGMDAGIPGHSSWQVGGQVQQVQIFMCRSLSVMFF